MMEDTLKQERLPTDFAKGVEQLIAEVHRLSAAGEHEKMAELLATPQYSKDAIKEMARRGEWQKFTERSRRIVLWAQQEASQRNSAHVETEHLLLSLLKHSKGCIAQLLKEMGVADQSVQQEIDATEQIIAEDGVKCDIGDGGDPLQDAPKMSAQAKRVVEFAAEEAWRIAKNLGIPGDIYPEHLLLGLLREESGMASRVLQKLGFDLESSRLQVAEHWRPQERA